MLALDIPRYFKIFPGIFGTGISVLASMLCVPRSRIYPLNTDKVLFWYISALDICECRFLITESETDELILPISVWVPATASNENGVGNLWHGRRQWDTRWFFLASKDRSRPWQPRHWGQWWEKTTGLKYTHNHLGYQPPGEKNIPSPFNRDVKGCYLKDKVFLPCHENHLLHTSVH